MLYLIDANVLIRAHEDYYPLDRVPQFWQWLEQQALNGRIKMPFEIYDEVAGSSSKGPLKDWISRQEVRKALVLDEEADADLLNQILADGYGRDLTDLEIEEIGRDPFLIAYALAAEEYRTVVTREASRPKAQRANRRIPDVCKSLGVKCIRDFDLYRELGFTTADK